MNTTNKPLGQMLYDTLNSQLSAITSDYALTSPFVKQAYDRAADLFAKQLGVVSLREALRNVSEIYGTVGDQYDVEQLNSALSEVTEIAKAALKEVKPQ